ncbi:dTMP kinase [Embleya scabrispora]|uniref:Thymidylate kinase n=1 Tax=Embleya scabrispora TaxID=159449 RepID=A0A1T3NI70_9ACTN|nr:dTMP kinase [Embleya scabrispora]OPC76493.1 dTMP kinase [Embleya scabrispora]
MTPTRPHPAPVHPFLVVEGLDGAGKTTLRKALFRLFEDLYGTTPLSLLTTNHLEPALVPTLVDGKFHPTPANRDAYLTAVAEDKHTCLHRLVHPHRRIRPILADRWLLSELAFFAVVHDLDPADTHRTLARTLDTAPDLTLVLDLPAHHAHTRARRRGTDTLRRDWDTPEVQARVHAAYDTIASTPERFPLLGTVVRIDARREPAELLHTAWDTLRLHGLLPHRYARA